MPTVIYEDKKLAFFWHHKCASTTFHNLFGRAWIKEEGLLGQGKPANKPNQKIPLKLSAIKNKFPDYFTFTFVRNPFYRTRSHWAYAKYQRRPRNIAFVSFEDFVLNHGAGISWLEPMSYYIDVDPDFVGKIEQMKKDIEKLCELKNITLPSHIPHKNRSHEKPKYTKEMRDVIVDFYKEDFERFGYRKYIQTI